MTEKGTNLVNLTRQFLHDLKKPITSGFMLAKATVELTKIEDVDPQLLLYLQELVKSYDDVKPQFIRDNFNGDDYLFTDIFSITDPAIEEVKEFLTLMETQSFEKNLLKNKVEALSNYSTKLNEATSIIINKLHEGNDND
jgi:hypothetical protein